MSLPQSDRFLECVRCWLNVLCSCTIYMSTLDIFREKKNQTLNAILYRCTKTVGVFPFYPVILYSSAGKWDWENNPSYSITVAINPSASVSCSRVNFYWSGFSWVRCHGNRNVVPRSGNPKIHWYKIVCCLYHLLAFRRFSKCSKLFLNLTSRFNLFNLRILLFLFLLNWHLSPAYPCLQLQTHHPKDVSGTCRVPPLRHRSLLSQSIVRGIAPAIDRKSVV